jgi:hypothetical protein
VVGSSSSDGSKPLILTLLVSYHDQRCLLCSTGRKVLPLASQIADPGAPLAQAQMPRLWRRSRPVLAGGTVHYARFGCLRRDECPGKAGCRN